jgi:hypothetical protein
MRTAVWLALGLASLWVVPARGEQRATGGQVVHSRRAPVVAHRLVPPFRGVHVYAGRSGRQSR